MVPGIRPRGAAANDQKRTLTPAEAVKAGADCLVVSRPVTGAPDPVKAMEAILAEVGS
jgi:orotidine-5'-phosphate decarboxylase